MKIRSHWCCICTTIDFNFEIISVQKICNQQKFCTFQFCILQWKLWFQALDWMHLLFLKTFRCHSFQVVWVHMSALPWLLVCHEDVGGGSLCSNGLFLHVDQTREMFLCENISTSTTLINKRKVVVFHLLHERSNLAIWPISVLYILYKKVHLKGPLRRAASESPPFSEITEDTTNIRLISKDLVFRGSSWIHGLSVQNWI